MPDMDLEPTRPVLPRDFHDSESESDTVDTLDLLGGYTDAPETQHASPSPHPDPLVPRGRHPLPVPVHQQQQQQQHYHYHYHHNHTDVQQRGKHTSHAHASYIAHSPITAPPSAASSRQPSPGHARSHTTPVVGTPKTNIIKRKPLSSTASPLATRFSEGAATLSIHLPKPETRFSRAYSVDSPTLYEYPAAASEHSLAPFILDSFPTVPTTLPHEKPPTPTNTDRAEEDDDGPHPLTRNTPSNNLASPQTRTSDDLPQHARLTNNVTQNPHSFDAPLLPNATKADTTDSESESAYSLYSNDNRTMSIIAPKPTPPHLNLDKVERNSHISTPPTTAIDSSRLPEINKPLPKSPGSTKFGSLFGWAISPSPSTTEFSSLPSPLSARNPGSTDEAGFSAAPSILQRKGSKANANPLGYLETNLLTPPPASTLLPPAQIQEMEDELKAISAELASSIRREMDLEDLVDRLQSEISNPQAPGKRTSDYFSDSGVSSTKFSEYDQNKEEVEKVQRRSEQEKASIRLELTTKVQEERLRRKALDQQIKELADRASQIDLAQMNNVDANGRVKELEATCEDLRRRLSEEKKVKDNFEDLLAALRGELQSASNERDNLRDEVVPQLRARVEGLEAEASEYDNLTYESSKLQQELHALKSENQNLRTIKQASVEEPPTRSTRSSVALSRSNSVTAGSFKLQRAPTGLTRSNTVKGGIESREALSERLKDVEAQRDALHSALKNLLDRQEFQNRENEKKIRVLETERERLLSDSPRRGGFAKDVSDLQNEIKVLRRRAEDAVNDKFQVEKGLVSLKMDLDRAEGEIASLRALLDEKDILIPPSMARSSSGSNSDAYPVTSESLEAAFKDLQAAYQEALNRIKELEEQGGAIISDERTQLALEKLQHSLSAAIMERDAARQEASDNKTQADSLHESEAKHIESERVLADELRDSARRVEELATQVRQQLAANASLRQRLADTVARGDIDRQANVERIASLQGRLRMLEEEVSAAQSASEDRVARHEEQIKEIKEAHNIQLRRALPSPASSGGRSPRKMLSPVASPMFSRPPRSPLPKMSIEDEVQVDKLRSRVTELERTLSEADTEMQDVIARMSAAQIEVLNLQEEREAAVRETRKLQRILEEERVKSFEDRFRTLSGNA
ncbi:hypothetical protein D7B24_000112 [Verticillium nonalfalfae]|uniref:DUF7603 domain-containing protein n=1 Tax=Verticillium nonalfalfae TaxID=1051616 RepID=A0A3M9YKX8_9PEZI|nr:uncharacterized protein D7B24_000112 [Verticillium nonalfalfae]RNJ61257.1 hypothetical protein D7B24_000112 [Verticillium nonalfalfae]